MGTKQQGSKGTCTSYNYMYVYFQRIQQYIHTIKSFNVCNNSFQALQHLHSRPYDIHKLSQSSIAPKHCLVVTLVNVYVDLLVFTRIAGTS